jgi:uncharacterized repeat protein (TIGR01451 family)
MPGSISGLVFADCNGNGQVDAGESGIEGVTITLNGPSGTLIATTDATGHYQFTDLMAGVYAITESQPAAFAEGTTTPGTPADGSASADLITGITLAGGMNLTGYNFGEQITQAAIDGKLTLTKTADKAVYAPGDTATFTYVVTNTSTVTMDGITIVDDNGTPGVTSDDFTVTPAGGITLAPGQSMTLTASRVVQGGSGSGPVVLNTSSTDYPLPGATGRAAIAFNESGALQAAKFDPVTGNLQVFYSDEHALTLGVSSVTVKTATGSTAFTAPITPLTSDPGSATNPTVGVDEAHGGTDTAGRPLAPSLFLTDLTVDGATSRAGDWQFGGAGVSPSAVFGTWKSATVLVDHTHSPAATTVTTASDPAKNGFNLGPGADPVPAGVSNLGYVSEVRWSLSDLQNRGLLIPGHTYRFYVMVHDGDQNKSGGDAGQASFTFTFPGAGSVTNTATATFADTACGVSTTAKATATYTVGTPPPPTPGAINIVKTASPSRVGLFQPVTYTYTVTNPGTTPLANVNVVDDNATPGYPADDFHPTFTHGDTNGNGLLDPGETWVYTATVFPPIDQYATTDSGANQLVGEMIPVILPNGNLRVSYIQSQGVNDNRYGTGATATTGWKGGHTFNDLVGSDKAEFVFTNSAGAKVLDFYVDYISASSAFPSGYGSLGVSGGDGKMLTGNAAYVLSATTSLTQDLLLPQFQHGFLVNSPAETAPNSGVSTVAGWDYNNAYTVVIDKAAFGGNVMTGLGMVSVPFQHNSPAKTNLKSPPTPGPSVNTATATATVSGSTGPVTASATASVQVTDAVIGPAPLLPPDTGTGGDTGIGAPLASKGSHV